MDSDQGDKQPSPSQRLPVNPRRHKVAPDQRKRVATACNNCNLRRIKCSGESPCSHCAASSRECIYPVPSAKVSIARSELDELRRRVEAYEKALQEVVPDASKRQELIALQSESGTPSESSHSQLSHQQQQHSVPLSPVRTEATTTTTEDELLLPPAAGSEGRLLHDAIGTARFHGDTSEVAFADSLKSLFRSSLHPNELAALPTTIGRCQTSDARPLPSGDVDPMWLPPPATIRTIFGVLRAFVQDGSEQQPYPSGGIYWWGNLLSVPSVPPPTGHVEADTRGRRRLAFYQTALAVACRIASTKPPGTRPDRSEPYFVRATQLLGNPMDPSRCSIGEVSVLTLMAYYLLETDRREAAWTYVALAARISLSIGAHKGFVDERGKRVFWTLYIMDRWLSCLVGRPPNLTDEAMQLPLPVDAQALPPAAGLRAHIELSRISNHIVCIVHRIDPSRDGASKHISSVEGALSMLENWKTSLPQALQLNGDGLSNDPAVCQLHLFHNELITLTLRPYLVAAAKLSLAQRTSPLSPAASSAYANSCVAAAQRNMRLARHAATLQQPRRLVHSGLHFVYSAVLCLLLQLLIRSNDISRGMDDDASSDPGREIDFAVELFDREAQAGNSYGFSCASTLRELRLLVSRQGSSSGRGSISGPTPMDIEHTLEHWQSPLSADTLDFTSQSQSSLQMGSDGTGLHDDVLSWMSGDWSTYERSGTSGI